MIISLVAQCFCLSLFGTRNWDQNELDLCGELSPCITITKINILKKRNDYETFAFIFYFVGIFIQLPYKKILCHHFKSDLNTINEFLYILYFVI